MTVAILSSYAGLDTPQQMHKCRLLRKHRLATLHQRWTTQSSLVQWKYNASYTCNS